LEIVAVFTIRARRGFETEENHATMNYSADPKYETDSVMLSCKQQQKHGVVSYNPCLFSAQQSHL
jgi:hypothetical protein